VQKSPDECEKSGNEDVAATMSRKPGQFLCGLINIFIGDAPAFFATCGTRPGTCLHFGILFNLSGKKDLITDPPCV
jgi:hypothetical protein